MYLCISYLSMKTKLYRISIRVHPAVRRYIDNNFPEKQGAYDLTRSMYYYLVSAMLYQSHVRLPSKMCLKYRDYVPISIFITEFDFYHYGFHCSEYQQCRLSRNILHLILDDACRRIAQAKVVFGVPVTKGIEHFLVDNFFEDGELDAEFVRTIYKRKYRSYESELREFYQNLTTDYGLDDEDVFKKKIVQIDPSKIKHEILWKI